MGEPTATAQRADAAYQQGDWHTARTYLYGLADAGTLPARGWFHLADCEWWLGNLDASLAAYEEAHRRHLDAGEPERAAMAALLLGAHAMERGEGAIGSGWMARARRLLDELPEGPEHGYPLYWEVFAALGEGDHDRALEVAARIQELGHRHDDDDLRALALLGTGRAQIKRGDLANGLRHLDEAMVMVLADQLHPLWAGAIYCHLMDVCHELQDLDRAGQWTDATASWCDEYPDAVLYRGICRVHRAQLLQRRGDWDVAAQEAEVATRTLVGVHVGTVAEAHYELGEVHRLRGELELAEDHFRQARELGRDPQPGLALLRWAQGQPGAACASLRAALADGSRDRLGRVPLCEALVDVSLALGEVEAARAAAAELRETAADFDSPGLTAQADQARGALLLAEAAPEEALPYLRSACQAWGRLQAPRDMARARLLLAEAHRALDDVDAADLERETAMATFERLGAHTDLVRARTNSGDVEPPDGLSPREVEVLRCVAGGGSNQHIADELCISERTVARHLANIYAKLGIASRSAATAYAFERGLVRDSSGAPSPGSP